MEDNLVCRLFILNWKVAALQAEALGKIALRDKINKSIEELVLALDDDPETSRPDFAKYYGDL